MDLWLRQKTSGQILINVLTVRVDFDVFRLRDYLGAGVGGRNEWAEGIGRVFSESHRSYETWVSWLTISANQFSSSDL